MKKYIFIVLLFPLLIFSTIYYKITSNEKLCGYASINILSDSISEKYLWIDGFSKEYVYAKHTFYNGYKYKSLSYYKNNALPKKIEFSNNKLYRKNYLYETKIKSDDIYSFVYNPFAPLSTIIYLNKNYINKKNIIDVITGNAIKNTNFFYCSNNELYPDTIRFYNYLFVKSKKITINNPYNMQVNDFSEKYKIKKHHRTIKIGSIIGEMGFNKLYDKIVIILPFDYYSDLYGNTVNSKSYNVLQIAEHIKYPTFIFDFNNYNDLNKKNIKKSIENIYIYFKRRFKKVVLIGFNQMTNVFFYSDINAKIIAFNPPVLKYNLYLKSMFSQLNKYNNYLFSNYNSYKNYDPFYTDLINNNFINEYNKHKNNLIIIFSKSVMNKNQLKNSEKIQCKKYYIRNIDRRLNSYIVNYDLWSFNNNRKIHRKIFDFINKILKNI